MLHRNFELILIKIRFLQIFKVAPKSGQSPCIIVQGFWPNFIFQISNLKFQISNLKFQISNFIYLKTLKIIGDFCGLNVIKHKSFKHFMHVKVMCN